MPAAGKKKVASKTEILEFLTGVMRNEELSEKERLSASFKLGRYLGLEGKETDDTELPRVVIYDGTDRDVIEFVYHCTLPPEPEEEDSHTGFFDWLNIFGN